MFFTLFCPELLHAELSHVLIVFISMKLLMCENKIAVSIPENKVFIHPRSST